MLEADFQRIVIISSALEQCLLLRFTPTKKCKVY